MNRTDKSKFYLAASIALLTFIVYLPALRNGFIEWDDIQYIVENPAIIRFDTAFLRWSFFGFHVSNWHPLTWISHALDYALWGLNPVGHHLTSIILHTVNTALVVLLSLKLFESVRERPALSPSPSVFLSDRTVLVAAGVTGLLFGIHPVHVESVAWVSERKDLLCALFFLLSIMSYVKYGSSRQSEVRSQEPEVGRASQKNIFMDQHYLLSLGCFVLALMSKPMAVSLPAVLLILDWHPLGRVRSWKTLRSAGVEKLPFIAFSLASAVLTVLAQRAGGAMVSSEVVPLSTRALVAANALIVYMLKMIVPFNLIPFYPYPGDVSSFAYLFAPILAIGATAACVIIAKKRPAWLAAWGYYVVTLLPVIGIVQVGAQAMADRYTYLPSLGPFLIAGSLAAGTSVRIRERWGGGGYRLFAAAVLLAAAALSSATVRQTGIWRDSIAFWSYELEKVPDANIAYVNRGIAFMKTGQFDKALNDYATAIARKPSDYKAFYSRALLFAKLNLLPQAIADYSTAIALKPSLVDAYNNRGLLYSRLGQPEKAMADYNAAISLNPSNYQPYVNRGMAYDKAGQPDRALADFDRAISLNPNDADAYFNRGLFFSRAGRSDRALADFDQAILLKPGDPDAYYNRGLVFQKTGQADKADRDFKLWKEYSAKR